MSDRDNPMRIGKPTNGGPAKVRTVKQAVASTTGSSTADRANAVATRLVAASPHLGEAFKRWATARRDKIEYLVKVAYGLVSPPVAISRAPTTYVGDLTEMQVELLEGIVNSDYDPPVWLFSAVEGIPEASRGGVVARAVDAGLVTVTIEKREKDSTIDITPLGLAALEKARKARDAKAPVKEAPVAKTVPLSIPASAPTPKTRIRVQTKRGVEVGVVKSVDPRPRGGWSANVELDSGQHVFFSNADEVPWEDA